MHEIDRSRSIPRVERSTLRVVTSLSVLVLALAGPLGAVTQSDRSSVSEDSAQARSAAASRLYVGMWTTHLRDVRRGLDSNALIGLALKGYYGATFINSFGDRSFALGIERIWIRGEGSFSVSLGYRAGLVAGYDERLMPFAGKTPVLPMAQVVGNLDHRKLGIDLAYAGVVASLSLSYRL